MHVNKVDLSSILGRDPKTLTALQKEPNFPILAIGGRGKANTYDTAAVINWLIQRELAKQQSQQSLDPDADTLLDKDEQLARKYFEEAEKLKRERERDEAVTLDAAQTVREFGERAQRGAATLQRYADEVAEMHLDAASPQQAKAHYLALIERVLNEWLDHETSAPGGGDEPNMGTSPAAA